MSEQAGSLREDSASPAAAAYRRRLAHDMREARHHLSAAGLTRPVEHDLTRSYAKNVLKSEPYYLLLVFAVLSTAWLWQPLAALVPGGFVLAAAMLVVGTACRRFLRHSETVPSLRTWRVGFLIADLALGTGWLVLMLPFLNLPAAESGSAADSFVLLVAIIVSGATAILRAPLPASVHAGTAPLALMVAMSALLGSEREHLALAFLALGFQLFILYFARRLHRAAVSSFRARAELRASFAELEQIKANTTHARQRAEEAERAKSQFLATVSHELRTPLNAILGFSEVMKNEVLGTHSTPFYREYSNDIHGSGQHLLALINEILELSRIESGRYELNEEWARLEDVIREAVVRTTDQAQAKSQALAVTVDPALERIWIDVRAVRQIVLNLLSNAVKFTPSGGHIAVKAGWTSLGGQYVSIADDGPGIPEEEIPVALSSFGRGTLAISTAAQGAGLGLPIAKGLADLHGGRFTLKSKPRAGTEAIVVFPANRCEVRPTDPVSTVAA